MEQSLQSVESCTKNGLSSLPPEILDTIFIHLEDKELLNASHVCKLFAVKSEIAFARQYAQKFWEIKGCDNITYGYHRAILTKYSGKMSNIYIYKLPGFKEECYNLNCLKLTEVPHIIDSTNLKEIQLWRIRNINKK